MKKLKVTKEDEAKSTEILDYLRAGDRIKAIIASSELAFNVVKNTNPEIVGTEMFTEVAEQFAINIYSDSKLQLGMADTLKKKIIPKSAIKRSVQ